MKKKLTDELHMIPGVGVSIADDLRAIGIRSIQDLKKSRAALSKIKQGCRCRARPVPSVYLSVRRIFC